MVQTLRKYLSGDAVIWMVIVLLSIFSLLAVYSSTGTLAYRFKEGNTLYYFFKHGTSLFLGLILIYVFHKIPYKYYSRLSQLLLIICIPMLALTLAMGLSVNSASRWLTLPGLGISFQTSDFAKLALIMYVARVLSLNQDNIKDFKTAFLPIIIPVGLVCLLILPSNFSTSALLFLICFVLMFIGRISLKYLFALMGIGILAMAIFVAVALWVNKEGRIGTWKSRIEHFTSGKSKGNYQVEQAKIAIVTGGVLGKGPGNSTQKNFLPQAFSDFIYAIIVEEYGLWGAILIVFLYMYLLFRTIVIIQKCERTFPAFLAIGLTLSLVIQAIINMAVAVNLLPVTGQTLPLVSMGGSSMLFTSIALGIILSISRAVTEPTPDDYTLEANAEAEQTNNN
jgi:cell division protein FtsW